MAIKMTTKGKATGAPVEPMKPRKVQVTLRIEEWVLEAYRAQGGGHITRMQDQLRKGVEK